jgi:methyl-accepting chemotaxis protein
MSEEQIAELRSRIAELEKGDADFARKSNILLDNILLNGEQIEKNTTAIDRYAQAAAESRRDIDQLAERIGDLAQEASQFRQELRESIESANQARREDIQVMVNIVDSLSASVRIAVEQSQASLAESQRIWEYLLRQSPNGQS